MKTCVHHVQSLTLSGFIGVCLVACGGANAPFAVNLNELEGGPLPGSGRALERASAETRALDLLGGTILEVESEIERGLAVWALEVRRPSGSIVEIDIVQATGDVLQVESDLPVAGDDLVVAEGFLSLTEVLALAAAVAPGAVVYWELEPDDEVRWTWDLAIELASGERVEVEIDARTGQWEEKGRDIWDDESQGRKEACGSVAVTLARALVPGGSVIDSEREEDDGRRICELELRTPGGAEVDVEVSERGELVEASFEEDDERRWTGDPITPPGLLSLRAALTMAGRVGGALEAWKLELEEGRFVWTLEFEDDEARVDASTGALLED